MPESLDRREKKQWKPLIFILAVSVVFFLPNPESLIVKAVERAGLVLILARGLMGHYDDFIDVLEERRFRRRDLETMRE
jgi:hypothetical protein